MVLMHTSATNVRKGFQSAPKDLFVYHTSHETTTDDISDWIKETAGIDTIEVEKRSPDHSYHGSFRVKLHRQDFEKALKPEMWPCGWSVRQYFHARKKPENPPKQRSPAKTPSRQPAAISAAATESNVRNAVNNIEMSNVFSVLPSNTSA